MAIDATKETSRREVRLVVGLGNPGAAFTQTYHNAGALAVQALAGEASWRKKDSFRYAKSGRVTFVLPEVFMNESGVAVAAALKYFKMRPADLLVVHDDSDLPVGEAKIQSGRGAAGHKGVASVIARLKTNEFPRARIGIRPVAEERRRKAGEFVLKKISSADRIKLEDSFKTVAAALFER